jgi:hypothetical protein
LRDSGGNARPDSLRVSRKRLGSCLHGGVAARAARSRRHAAVAQLGGRLSRWRRPLQGALGLRRRGSRAAHRRAACRVALLCERQAWPRVLKRQRAA